MNAMIGLTQVFIRDFCPRWNAFISRLLFSGFRVSIGSQFRVDGIPRIIVDRRATLKIGNGVEFRRNVEIRVHGKAMVVIGDNVRIDRGVRILATNSAIVEIKSGARIGLYSVLNGGDSITVGVKALLSGFVYLQTSMHGYKSRESLVQDQGYSHAPVVLEDDCWLGAHAVVLPGVTIRKGAVVGSNAVVTSSVESYMVVAGVPARVIKER